MSSVISRNGSLAPIVRVEATWEGALPGSLRSASSSGDTDACSRGVLRTYQAQPATSASDGKAVQNSARCQPNLCIRKTITAGAAAAPNCALIDEAPLARPHLRVGSQARRIPWPTGKVGAWARPNTSCDRNRPANTALPVSSAGTSGIAIVATTATAPATANVRRAPKRWPTRPLNTWLGVYASRNAHWIQPICIWLSDSSGMMRSAAIVTPFCWK